MKSGHISGEAFVGGVESVPAVEDELRDPIPMGDGVCVLHKGKVALGYIGTGVVCDRDVGDIGGEQSY